MGRGDGGGMILYGNGFFGSRDGEGNSELRMTADENRVRSMWLGPPIRVLFSFGVHSTSLCGGMA